MIGESECSAWLETKWLLGQFGSERNAAVGEYIDFVRAGVGLPSLWGELRNQIYLGGERFVDRMKQSVSPKELSINN